MVLVGYALNKGRTLVLTDQYRSLIVVVASYSVLPYARVKLPNRMEQDETLKAHGEKDLTRLGLSPLKVSLMKLHLNRVHGWPLQTKYGVPYNPRMIKLFGSTVNLQHMFKY